MDRIEVAPTKIITSLITNIGQGFRAIASREEIHGMRNPRRRGVLQGGAGNPRAWGIAVEGESQGREIPTRRES